MMIDIRKALPENAYAYTLCHVDCWQDADDGVKSW